MATEPQAKKVAVVPRHVGIIMDGNRRWARSRGLSVLEGHNRARLQTVPAIVRHAFERGVEHLTLFAFSEENWNRDAGEVKGLLGLFVAALHEQLDEVAEAGARVRFLGRVAAFPAEVREAARLAEERTASNAKGFLNVCFGYGGQQEIADAAASVVRSGVAADEVTVELVRHHLYVPDVPDVDLVIRTSGEQRTSGFMLWRAAYAELYFCDKHWPDFAPVDFDEALVDFAARRRRFGG